MLFSQFLQGQLSHKAFSPATNTTEGANATFPIGLGLHASRYPECKPNNGNFNLSPSCKRPMKILKAVSNGEHPAPSHPTSPTSPTNFQSTKAVYKHDQSIVSGQHTSTRAFFESLTKPTHEDTVLLHTHRDTFVQQLSTPDIPATRSPASPALLTGAAYATQQRTCAGLEG